MKDEALKLALEVMHNQGDVGVDEWIAAEAAINQALAAPVQLVAGLEQCEFDDECEFCKSPQGGSFTRLIHNAEDCTEAEFYICGDCVHEALRRYTTQPAAAQPTNQCGETCERAKLCATCGGMLAQPEQEPVCDKDPQGCWNVRCQLGDKCKNTPTAAQPAAPDFKAFKAWANDAGYDTAYTNDGVNWICLNPMTADLWKAWQAAHGIKEKNT